MLFKKREQKDQKKKPDQPEIKVAYFGFTCPICGSYVPKGANYLDHDGFKMCTHENLDS